MEEEIIDNVCVIVGAGSGVSMGVAHRFGREGFAIALIARRAEKLADLVAELKDAGIEALGFPADASAPADIENAIQHIEEQFGPINVLVYNAAKVHATALSELPLEELMTDLQINVGGALLAAQQVIPSMQEEGGGTILITGGGLALQPRPEYASLAAGKAALRNLTYSLAAELAEDNIHVATVTIAGFVQPNTFFDPHLIAEKYWQLHTQKKDMWETEIVYREA